MPQAVEQLLRGLQTSDRVRAVAFDAVYNMDDSSAEDALRGLPLPEDVKATLWDARQAPLLSAESTPSQAETPGEQPSALSRFVSNAAEMLNPITMAQGAYQAVRHPIETGSALWSAQGEQFSKAGEAFQQGRYGEAIGHGTAGMLPVLGPVAADIGEQIGSGDVAGGLGAMTGLLAPVVGARPLAQAARRGVPAAARNSIATSLERGASRRVTDVMAPKVGPNKTRFGNQAEKAAPRIAKDLATDGAPLTREGLHTQVQSKLAAAESALDDAASARNTNAVIHTAPLIRALKQKRADLTSQTHRIGAFKAGDDVVPAPNAARVAQIDQAIDEIGQLGPVANYESLRRIRQAYDGPAKATYSPSMTADYLKAQGSKLGAADVTGTLREHLARMDPKTAAANAEYSVYRAADDVMSATAEIERTRPRVGRQIAARITGAVVGGQHGGAAGALAGYAGAPIVDAALSAGVTTQLKTAALMQRLANAVRAGSMERVNGVLSLLSRELKTTVPLQAERATRPSESRTQTTAPSLP